MNTNGVVFLSPVSRSGRSLLLPEEDPRAIPREGEAAGRCRGGERRAAGEGTETAMDADKPCRASLVRRYHDARGPNTIERKRGTRRGRRGRGGWRRNGGDKGTDRRVLPRFAVAAFCGPLGVG